MENVNIIDIIECVSTVISLILSVFATASVIEIKRVNNINKQIGKTNINGDNSTVFNGDNACFTQVVDEKIPDIDKAVYYFDIRQKENCNTYFCNMQENTLQAIIKNNNLFLKLNFTDVVTNPIKAEFAGYCIKSLPMTDWRGFIKNDYILTFEYTADFTGEFQLEIGKEKVYQLPISFNANQYNSHKINLRNYSQTSDNWKSINEICFVFFPKKCENSKGTIHIENLRIVERQ